MSDSRSTICRVLLLGLLCWTAAARIVGGWTTQAVNGSPKYDELAHYAVSSQTRGLEYFDTVLQLLKVETQVRRPCLSEPSVASNVDLDVSFVSFVAAVEYFCRTRPPWTARTHTMDYV